MGIENFFSKGHWFAKNFFCRFDILFVTSVNCSDHFNVKGHNVLIFKFIMN